MKSVYVVGWSSKTINDIVCICKTFEKAQEVRKEIVQFLAPAGSDFDGSYILEKKLMNEEDSFALKRSTL